MRRARFSRSPAAAIGATISDVGELASAPLGPPPGGQGGHKSSSFVERLPSAIAAALDDLCEDLERVHVRHEQRLQVTRCISAADELIEELEGLSLAGWIAVPDAWQPRLDQFVASLPAGVGGELRSGGEPNRLLDQVFAIEERLFRLKLGEWARAFGLS